MAPQANCAPPPVDDEEPEAVLEPEEPEEPDALLEPEAVVDPEAVEDPLPVDEALAWVAEPEAEEVAGAAPPVPVEQGALASRHRAVYDAHVRFCEVCGAAFQSLSACPRDKVRTRADLGDPLIASVLGDRYRILERVAAGGMGQVYLAAHTRIACLFAVKVLYGDLAFEPAMQARFLREAEVASCLSSRHIVRVVDFGQSAAGLPYLVMEYLDGPTLFDVVTREGALAPRRAARIAQRIARGLSHAHERGIVHRDMKTENVILMREDDEVDIPRLLDFGVARLRESGAAERLTTAGVVLGTPLYMAPEQFLGGEVDARADLYALGIILFEMLTGVPPFEGTTLNELAQKHLVEPPPSLAAKLPTSEAGLDAIVRRLLSKDPAGRHASARELIDALAELETRAVVAPSFGPPPRALTDIVDAGVLAKIEATIVEGAPIYNAGDHARCAALYKRTVEALIAEVKQPIAALARLRTGLRRADTRQAPTLAAWELRYTFDDLLFASPAEAAPDDLLASEVAAYSSLAARRESAMHLGILGDFALDFACLLSERLREKNVELETASLLERAVAEAMKMGSGQLGLAPLQHAIDQIRARYRKKLVITDSATGFATTTDESRRFASGAAPVSIAAPSVGPSIPPLPSRGGSESTPPSGVTEDLSEAIVRAISIGAPAYNEGRYEVCHRVYRETCETLRSRLASDPSGIPTARWLAEVTERASTKSDRDAAWVYRHAFDALLAWRR